MNNTSTMAEFVQMHTAPRVPCLCVTKEMSAGTNSWRFLAFTACPWCHGTGNAERPREERAQWMQRFRALYWKPRTPCRCIVELVVIDPGSGEPDFPVNVWIVDTRCEYCGGLGSLDHVDGH